ncbi:MAG TPA: hypothetical protein GX003_02410 [Acholeplasmataceae bacterium]|nr:hypothetical protein [Acholeplasmataceae bacterium]
MKINSKVTGTIIITGNGFDLQCGLNSSYRHFFEWCQKMTMYLVLII